MRGRMHSLKGSKVLVLLSTSKVFILSFLVFFLLFLCLLSPFPNYYRH
jgi:hypothetical protein